MHPDTALPLVRIRGPSLLLAAIVAGGGAAAGWSVYATQQNGNWLTLLPFLGAALVAEALKVQVSEIGQQRMILSLTVMVTMAAVAWQPSLAPLVSLAAALVFVLERRRGPPAKILTNLAAPTMAAGAASLVYLLLRPPGADFSLWHLAAALGAVLAFYTINTGVIVLMISASTGRPVGSVARAASWFGPANILLGLTGAFVGGSYDQLGPIGALLFAVPVLLLRITLAWHARQSQQAMATLEAAWRQAEAAEARYRGLFEGAAEAVLVTDEAGQLLDANSAASQLLALPREALLGRRLADVIGGEAAVPDAILAALRHTGRWHGEVDVAHPDGGATPVEWWATAVSLPSGPVFISALRDISERRLGERMQQEFTAMMTHELNTPLTTIKGQAQVILRRHGDKDPAARAIIAQAEHLTRLASELLDVSRLAAGALPLHRRSLDLATIVRGTAGQARSLTQRHRIRVVAPAGGRQVWADRDRLTQVLHNLLTNAIKYSPDGGEVVVQVAYLPHEARVSVTDQGCGIEPEELPRLFDRFYRTKAAIASQIKGLGLGLYICRRLVEAHGGRIWAESTPGQGSAFHFTLPYSPDGATTAPEG
jgi:PAS domain S-box-containing protein